MVVFLICQAKLVSDNAHEDKSIEKVTHLWPEYWVWKTKQEIYKSLQK